MKICLQVLGKRFELQKETLLCMTFVLCCWTPSQMVFLCCLVCMCIGPCVHGCWIILIHGVDSCHAILWTWFCPGTNACLYMPGNARWIAFCWVCYLVYLASWTGTNHTNVALHIIIMCLPANNFACCFHAWLASVIPGKGTRPHENHVHAIWWQGFVAYEQVVKFKSNRPWE